ncbi:MAG: hypothetical protein C0415_05430 [Thermodesulfovibrio sp.]|nr:hypothetical protein [Thermodesulfovibrio sp.]
MKLFYKIFIPTFISFWVIVLSISYIITTQQISDIEKDILDEKRILGSFISKQVEVGYFESNWPFESLNKLSKHKGVLFWWIVRDDGMIYLADDTSFMGTYVQDYFPKIAGSLEKEDIYLNRDQNHGIFFNPLETGKIKWSFWYGFSLNEISEKKKHIITLISVISISATAAFGVILFLAVKRFTKPIGELVSGTAKIGKGDFTYRIRIESGDELGKLANSFNNMAEDLQNITVSRDELTKEINNRKRIEEALLNSEQRFRIAAESTNDLIYEWDISGGHLTWFGDIDGHLGYEPDEFPRTIDAWENAIHPDDHQHVTAALEQHLKTKQPFIQEYRVLRKDGTIIYWRDHGSAMWDEEGNTYKMIGACRDITKRKHAEEEREHLILQLQATLDKVKTLTGLLPICSSCKKIRDDKGYWNQVEVYISEHSEAEFTHGYCPDCLKKMYLELDKLKKEKLPDEKI